MAETNNSIAALIKSNARLKKNAAVAKAVVARKDYSGPAGDIICKFTLKSVVTIQDNPCVILEFKVVGDVPGQEDHNGERIAIFNKFYDDDYGSVESRQAEMFERIQLMGIDTKTLTMEQIDKELDNLRSPDGELISIKCVKKPGKNQNVGKIFTNYFINGVAKAGEESPDYSEGEKGADEVVADSDDEANEWDEELNDDEGVEATDSDELTPCDWVGFEVEYKPAGAKGLLKFEVIDADDEAMTVTLKRGKKTITDVAYDKLVLPPE